MSHESYSENVQEFGINGVFAHLADALKKHGATLSKDGVEFKLKYKGVILVRDSLSGFFNWYHNEYNILGLLTTRLEKHKSGIQQGKSLSGW